MHTGTLMELDNMARDQEMHRNTNYRFIFNLKHPYKHPNNFHRFVGESILTAGNRPAFVILERS